MKKLATLLLAAGLVFAASAPANAGDVKLGADMWMIGAGGSDAGAYKPFNIYERIRMNFQYVASEPLSGFIQLQAGNSGVIGNTAKGGIWGQGSKMMNGTDNDFYVRQAYLDWMIPGTRASVRMGLQNIALPSAVFGNPVLDDIETGAVVNVPVNDILSLTAGYIRDIQYDNGAAYYGYNGANGGFLTAIINANNVTFSPWLLYNRYCNDSINNTVGDTGWWLGASAQIKTFEPLTIVFDAMYGRDKWDNNFSEKGWYVAAGASYETAYGSPALKGWYASGDKAGNKDFSGNMPVISGTFTANQLYFDDGLTYKKLNGVTNPGGTWGLSLGWEGISFINDLKHSARIVYTRGTNSHANGIIGYIDSGYKYPYMTSRDTSWEFDLNTTYDIYKNLTLGLELGYAVNRFEDPSVKNSWAVLTSFAYKF